MNLNSELSRESLTYFYKEYKQYVLPLGAIVVSFILIVIFLIPQLISIPSKREEIGKESEKLSQLTDAQKTLAETSTQTLDSNLTTATNALPIDKNFESILGSISSAAATSGIAVVGYQFQADDLSLPGSIEQTKFPLIRFTLNVSGSPVQMSSFINQMYKSYPVVEVDNIEFKKGVGTIELLFYYKPIPPQGFGDVSDVRKMTPKEQDVLSEISTWSGGSQQPEIQVVTEGENTSAPNQSSSPF